MTEVRAVIDCASIPTGLLTRRVLGVPLLLWSFGALLRVLPAREIALKSAEPELLGIASGRGLHALGPRQAPGALLVDPAQPFCRSESLRAAIEQGTVSLGAHQTGAIERVRVVDEESFALADALARGLDPDDPHVRGISALRLPLDRPVRALVCDVDGCLTDGGVWFGDGEAAGRRFTTHDGLGLKRLMNEGVKVGWLSATTSGDSISRRAEQIGIEVVDTGSGDKGPRFHEVCARLGVPESETLYIGDDLNDLPAMARAGTSACPADARPEVRARVDLILECRGGNGAVRELCDLLLASDALARSAP